jgi:DNA-directed RNA polymerase subunit omega
MINPDIGSLMKNMDSRYTLVIAVAKRARQLNDGFPKFTKYNSDKFVTIAMHEVKENKIHYTRTKNGIK